MPRQIRYSVLGLVWFVLVPGACGLLIGLILDGVIAVPLHKLADFPLKGRPATNGALFGTFLNACGVIAVWFYWGWL